MKSVSNITQKDTPTQIHSTLLPTLGSKTFEHYPKTFKTKECTPKISRLCGQPYNYHLPVYRFKMYPHHKHTHTHTPLYI